MPGRCIGVRREGSHPVTICAPKSAGWEVAHCCRLHLCCDGVGGARRRRARRAPGLAGGAGEEWQGRDRGGALSAAAPQGMTNLVGTLPLSISPRTRLSRWWQPFINDYQMISSRNAFTGDKFVSPVQRLAIGCGSRLGTPGISSDLSYLHGAAVDLPEGRTLSMFADLRYEDGTSQLDVTMPIGSGSFPWTRRSIILHAEKLVRS